MECHHKILLKSGLIVPCGKCPACLANERQEWIFRIKQEYLDSVFAIFVTLTYDDDHLPKDLSVNKRDVQLFHKRLRKYFPSGDMRFYLVSEYGDHTFRPHYHGLYFFKHNYDLNLIYSTFEKAWNNGFCKFGAVEEGSIVYCTKYCMKLCPLPEGRTKPFRLLSKMNGGLGSGYLNKMSDYHDDTKNFDFVSSDGRVCRMPKYYKDKLKKLYNVETIHDRDNRLQDYYTSKKDLRLKRFKLFCKDHKGLDYSTLVQLFESKEKESYVNSDQLVIKHIKKQTF